MHNKIVIPLVLIGLHLAACSERSVWEEDVAFSEGLTLMAERFEVANGLPASSYVDALVVYKVEEDAATHQDLPSLRRTTPLYETRNAGVIERILRAAAAQSETTAECLGAVGDTRFYFVAYDRTLLRAGLFLSRICETKNGRRATIEPLGQAGIYASREFAAILQELAPTQSAKK